MTQAKNLSSMKPSGVEAWLADLHASNEVGNSPVEQDESSESRIATPEVQYDTSFKLSESTSPPPLALDAIGSASNCARSTSPIKRADDLQYLDKPVYWKHMSAGDLTKRISETQDDSVKLVLQRIKRVTVSSREYLPQRLRENLVAELGLEESDTHQFTERIDLSLQSDEIENMKRDILEACGSEKEPNERLEKIVRNRLYFNALKREMEALKSIVSETDVFKSTPNPEPEWNQKIHGPMLDLAIRDHRDKVEYKNVTIARVASPFMPDTKAPTALRYATKMIDYVLALRVDKNGFGGRVRGYTKTLDPPYFNQSTADLIRFCPTGVFIETKVNGSVGWSEGKAQLGFWLAAWFKRVSAFPERRGGAGSRGVAIPPMPVILAACDRWELHFAFDCEDEIEICGGLDIGGTGHLDAAYRLLAVLRVLVDGWMDTRFRQWVEEWL